MFPTELWMAIVDLIDELESLLVLSRTSRMLHGISLRAFFKVLNSDFGSKDIYLKSHITGRNCTVLRALCCSLEVGGQSVEELVYDCGNAQFSSSLVEELRLLSHYILTLSSVSRVTLRLCSPPSTQVHSHKIYQSTTDVLESALQAKCSDMHVTTTQLTASHDRSILGTSSVNSYQPSHWLQKHSKTGGSHIGLERCSIQTFPRYLRPFYLSTLQTHSEVLTSLHFKNIFGSDPDFSTLLSLLHLPRLKHFCLKYATISRPPIVKFLIVHSHIESLEYHHIRYLTSTSTSKEDAAWHAQLKQKNSIPALEMMCRSLTQVVTSPEQLVNFLPSPITKMQHLRDVTIGVESQSSEGQFAVLDEALAVVSKSVHPIKLHLRVGTTGLGLAIWLSTPGMSNPSNRPETKMRAVETLVLDNGDWDLTEIFYLRVIPWVGMFPAVEDLTLQCNPKTPTLARREATAEDAPLAGTFAASLKAASPSLKVVRVRCTFDWIHRYE